MDAITMQNPAAGNISVPYVSMKLLSTMAAIRLDEDGDNIENTLPLALLDTSEPGTTDRSIQSFDPLVLEEKTLITPVQFEILWRQFKAETEYTVTQAIAPQEANKRNNDWLPPPWALAAIAIAILDSLSLWLLRNPLYLGVIFVAYLVGKAIWVQPDMVRDSNMDFPTVLSLSATFVPAVISILKRLAEEWEKTCSPREAREIEP
ncbi:hypothetical protein ACP4OV_006196 [Aristida adscensionis]